MPMCCLWPDCQGLYCKKKCPHQEELLRANGWRDFEQNPTTPELQAEFDRVFPLLSSRDGDASPRVVG